MAYTVYIIECLNGRLYTGIAIDPEARFEQHIRGKGARFTRSNKPVKIAYLESAKSRSAALKREYAIKQLTRSAKLELIKTHRLSMLIK